MQVFAGFSGCRGIECRARYGLLFSVWLGNRGTSRVRRKLIRAGLRPGRAILTTFSVTSRYKNRNADYHPNAFRLKGYGDHQKRTRNGFVTVKTGRL